MKNVSLIKLLAILSAIVLPILEMHQNVYAKTSFTQKTVLANQLNVREAADKSSKIIGLVHQGETFEILQTKNYWDEIKLANNQMGWVFDSYLTSKQNIKATIGAIVLRVHKNPYLSSGVVGKLKWGSKVTITEENGGWAKVVSLSGLHGWVSEKYITKDASSSEQLVAKASAPRTKAAVSSKPPSQPPISDVNIDSQFITTDILQNSLDPLKGKTIVLDPGHGGKDDGTTSIVGTNEKALTLATAEAVEQKLENAGAIVYMTRTDDTYIPLQQRADLSNQNHADAFISFHYNWSDDSLVKGLTDYYYQSSKDAPLASDILNEVVKTTGLKNDGTEFDDLEVLRNNSQPSTLIELGFLSNKQDDEAVESSAYLNNVAQGVYLGLVDYFSNKK